MHILDVFKPRRRAPLTRRKSQSSIIDTTADDVSAWDPWAEYPYAALDGRFPTASPTETLPRTPRSERWNVIDHPHHARRRTTGSASVADSDDRDTISVHSDRTAQAPAVRRQPYSPTASETSGSIASFASGSAPTYIDHRLTQASSPTYVGDSEAPPVEREASGSRMRPAPVMPSLTGMPVRGATQHSSHGSVHRPERSRDVYRGRNASPTPSTMSSGITHTLDNGTKIHVPTSPSPERGRSPARPADVKRRTFYIVPPGMNVIFTDDMGAEITRVGEFRADGVRYRESPIILKDERGRVIYQTGKGNRMTYDVEDRFDSDRPNVIHLGNFVPESSWSVPITVSLDKRGHEMVIYDAENTHGTLASTQDGSSRAKRPPPARARSAGTLYTNPSAQSTPSFHVGSLK